uniref:PNPLA domain-containing protein n=1 Tax=viral metagenome TaxID=1070528 RepID=A0A6M3IW57_9ZZZZ
MIKNMVFEGGGVKGIAYVGALEVFEEQGLLKNVEGFGGTSAGAIMACLCALKLPIKKMLDILWKLDFNALMDDDWGALRDTHRLLHDFGWYKGDYFLQWIKGIIHAETGMDDLTFYDLHHITYRDLRVIGANLSTGYSEVFSYKDTPFLTVAAAVRISMSIPLFFKAVPMTGGLYVDGGLFRNFPVQLFDEEFLLEETVGFRLDSTKEITAFKAGGKVAGDEIVNFKDYITSLVHAIMNGQEDRHLHSKDWERTVYIDTGDVSSVDFDLSNEKKQALLKAGRLGAKNYLGLEEGNA